MALMKIGSVEHQNKLVQWQIWGKVIQYILFSTVHLWRHR